MCQDKGTKYVRIKGTKCVRVKGPSTCQGKMDQVCARVEGDHLCVRLKDTGVIIKSSIRLSEQEGLSVYQTKRGCHGKQNKVSFRVKGTTLA